MCSTIEIRSNRSRYHIGIGRVHARKHILMLIHDANVTISDATTGEIIRELTIDPNRDYQPKHQDKEKHPGPKTGV